MDKAIQTEGVDDKIDEWLEWDKNPDTFEEIKSLRDLKSIATLKKLFFRRLEFSSKGLRGQMGAGFSKMNDLVVIQTTQGLLSYLKSMYSEETKMPPVTIGYDVRRNSKRFAELAATILVNSGIRVYLFSDICPSAFVPFCLKINKCMAGIMITASRCQKNYNGYKVYWQNAIQAISPHTNNIQAHILINLVPWENSWNTEILQKNPLVRDPLVQISARYFLQLRQNFTRVDSTSTIKITYTSMHGAASKYVVEAFKVAGLNPPLFVQEEQYPDPNFPTIDYPNPADRNNLRLAFTTAEAFDSPLILASDPIAGRVSLAEKNTSGYWRFFTSSEIQSLLGWWMYTCYMIKHPEVDTSTLHIVGSATGSRLIKTMAQQEGINFVETLPSFKWIGNTACHIQEEGGTVIFASGESYDFMCDSTVFDKDGLSASLHLAELATHLDIEEDMSLDDKLQELNFIYGFHLNLNSNFLCPNVEAFFWKLRNYDGKPNNYPESLLDGKYSVQSVKDVRTGHSDQEPKFACASLTEMMTFTYDCGLEATIRASDSEPKVKLYMQVHSLPGAVESESDLEILEDDLQEAKDAFMEELILPNIPRI